MDDVAKLRFNEFRKVVDEHLDKYIDVVYHEKIYEYMKQWFERHSTSGNKE